MKNAIGYLRVSTINQANLGFGLDTQKAIITEYAASNDYNILEWVVDRGVSGASPTRPEFDRILYGDVANPPYEAVIVAKSDRVARDINLYFGYRYLLSKKDIDLLSAEVDFGQAGVFTHILEAFLSTMAELERNSITSRTSAGRRVKAYRGQYAGGTPPMGYSVKDGNLVINPDEAKLVLRIFELRAFNYTLRDMAVLLEDEGYVGRSGQPLKYGGINRILKNKKFYEGYYRYGDIDWVEGVHEPLFGEDEFKGVNGK